LDALAGVLYHVTSEWDVPLIVTRGYPSISYLRAAVRRELRERGYRPSDFDSSRDNGRRERRRHQEEQPPPPPPAGDGIRVAPAERELFVELVSAGYRSLAQRHHPDHGGDAEKMKQLNSLAETLR
jgi:hypothetical protein